METTPERIVLHSETYRTEGCVYEQLLRSGQIAAPTPQLNMPDLFKALRELVEARKIAFPDRPVIQFSAPSDPNSFEVPASMRLRDEHDEQVRHAAEGQWIPASAVVSNETTISKIHLEALADEVEDPRMKLAGRRFEELTGSSSERAEEDERPQRKYWSREQAINYLKVVGLYDFLPECYK